MLAECGFDNARNHRDRAATIEGPGCVTGALLPVDGGRLAR
jgi:hypothetical protein